MKIDEQNFENNVVDALLGAAQFRANPVHRKITIERAGFSFEIHGVNEDEVARAQKLSTKNRGRRNEETDWGRYAAQLIFFATVDEDQKRLWNNREVWEKLDCVTGADVVYKCLTPAERAQVVSVIEKLSGYDDSDLDIDDAIKN